MEQVSTGRHFHHFLLFEPALFLLSQANRTQWFVEIAESRLVLDNRQRVFRTGLGLAGERRVGDIRTVGVETESDVVTGVMQTTVFGPVADADAAAYAAIPPD